MVEEALVATFEEKVQPNDGDADFWQERLRYLLDYEDAFSDANDLFEEKEAANIVRAIGETKVLDPAVGSGAFPMAVLHKLTLALRRLDPENVLWENFQKAIAGMSAQEAFEVQNQQKRDAELKEISDTFEKYRDSDFGRKLYLIQNSIYGVDIQTIACPDRQAAVLHHPGYRAENGRNRGESRHQAAAQPRDPLRRRRHTPGPGQAGPVQPRPDRCR